MTNTKSKKIIADDAVVRRLYARGMWRLKSAAHFGGDETGIADMCLLRDAKGNPFVPGASIAGAARSFLARQRLAWAQYSHKDGINSEPPELKSFFGGSENKSTVKDSDPMSALIVADAVCVSEEVKTFIRDGVRVDAESGSAAEGAKFDVEVLERGTEFLLNFQCIIREDDDNVELTNLFLAMLYGFKKGDIQLGARTRRGYGRGKVDSWKIYDLQMNNPQHVWAWLQDKPELQNQSHLKPRPLQSDQRNYFRIEADFQLRTSLLIRSSSEDPKEPDKVPDMVHLHSNGKPVIPGTSFAGAFRHRAALIANAIGWQKHGKDEDAVCEMFGPIHKQGSNAKKQTDLWASRVTIEERLVENVKPQWQDRVAIDRFTGGSLQSALFNQKPVYPCSLKESTETNVRLILTLEEPDYAEIGLLYLTLRDFWYGHAALGGETSNGRGTLKGIEATFRLKRSDASGGPKEEIWEFKPVNDQMALIKDNVPFKSKSAFLKCCIARAQSYANRPPASRRSKKDKEDSDAE